MRLSPMIIVGSYQHFVFSRRNLPLQWRKQIGCLHQIKNVNQNFKYSLLSHCERTINIRNITQLFEMSNRRRKNRSIWFDRSTACVCVCVVCRCVEHVRIYNNNKTRYACVLCALYDCVWFACGVPSVPHLYHCSDAIKKFWPKQKELPCSVQTTFDVSGVANKISNS